MITRFLWQGMTRNLRLFVLLVLAVGILVPLSNQLLPPGSAFPHAILGAAAHRQISLLRLAGARR
jgi:hypothetical protein